MSDKLKEKKQIQYLNIIKFLAIFLVVFCHIPMLRNDGVVDNIAMLFCWTCVPCFFMVNGALLFNKDMNIKKHYKKILVIYIVNIIWKLIYAIIELAFLDLEILEISKSEIFKYLFLFGKIKGINTDHMYFIEALIAIYLIFPVLYNNFKTREGRKCLIILCICIFVFTYGINAIDFVSNQVMGNNKLSISGLKTISLFERYAHFLLFFILGAFWHDKHSQIKKVRRIRIYSFGLMILALVGLIYIKYSINNTFQWKWIYLQNGYGRLCTFVMSIAMFIFLQNVQINNKYIDKFISEISNNTLGIYYMHIPILLLFNKFLYKLIPVRGVFINSLKTILIIIITYGITKVIKKIPIVKKIVQ